MKKNLLISLSLLLLYSGSSAQTAIPCSINYATTNRKALSGDLAGFNNNDQTWKRPINYNKSTQNVATTTADNAIDSRLAGIIKNELGEIIYRNSGGMAERYNIYFKGWGYSNPAVIKNSVCDIDGFELCGANNAASTDWEWRANSTNRDIIYGNTTNYPVYGYVGYPESKDNMIYPMINIIKSTTNNRIANYTININAHYKKQRPFTDCNNVSIDNSVRAELFTKTPLLWTINSFDEIALPANGFSTAFKEQVKANIDGILTMMLDGVDVRYIELGNEQGHNDMWFNTTGHDAYYDPTTTANRYSNFINLPPCTKFPGNLPFPFQDITWNDYKTAEIWSASHGGKFFTSNNTASFAQINSDTYAQATLNTYGALLHMYVNVIKDAIGKETGIGNRPNISAKKNTIKFGVSLRVGPIPDTYNETSDPFYAAYLNYLFTNQSAIGFVGYIIHPYLNLSGNPMTTTAPTSSNLSTLDAYFNEMRNKSTAFIDARYRLKSGTINSPTITTPYYPANNTFYSKLPANAELWLTEWGTDPNANKISNTLLDAMYYMDAHLAMQDINTGINMIAPYTQNNKCQLANYHLLFGGANNGVAGSSEAILGVDYNVTSGNNSGISKQAVFYAHKMLKPLFTVKPDYIANTNGGFNLPAPITKDSVSFRTYIKENVATGDSLVLRYCNKLGCFSNWHSCFTDKEIYIYFNNKSNRDYKIDLSTALTGQTGRVYSIEQNRMYATKLSASRGITTFRTDTTLYEAVGNINTDKTIQIQNGAKFSYYNTDGTTVSTAVKNFIISKYSLGYIKITLRVYSTPQPNLCALPQRIATSEIKDIDDSKKITDKQIIYPNPTTGLVNLNVQLSEPVDKYTIEVFSVDGRVVLSEIHNEKLDGNTYVNNTINISNQPNGVYFIRIISDKNVLLNNKVLLNK